MKIRLLFYTLFLVVSLPIWSQKLVEKGHKQFQQMAYSDAIISLEKAVEKGYKNPRIYTELADSYYFNANYQASAKWFALLFETENTILPVHQFRYAQTLKSIGKYEEAKAILNKIPNNSFDENFEFLKKIEKDSSRFQIRLVDFNSPKSDFGPSYFGNQLVFASAKDTGSVFKRNHSWTNQSFTDLYVIDPDSLDSKSVKFSKKINSNFNESTAVFTKDGLTMYFTSNNNVHGKQVTNAAETTLLKIYKAEKKASDWDVIGPLPFCDSNFSVAHPALSPDEKTLYFVSDKPGGFGQSDLYKVTINPDGSFGIPENLGEKINTFGRESFPFVSQNNELYFASDGLIGLGGFDVFVTEFDENNNFLEPQNIGKPVNSNFDDFGYIINLETKTGYFTSNRPNGIGMDDIYAFQELYDLPCETILNGKISYQNLENATTNVEVELLDTNLNLVKKSPLDETGMYRFTVDCTKKYKIRVTSNHFEPEEISPEITKLPITTMPLINLKKTPISFQIGDDLAKILALQPIYFDLGKSNIRPDAALELLKIKNILIENPTLKINVRSHTDSRDSFENNYILSTKRAQSTVNWFTENGINAERISGTGFGETQLLNNCSDGISCSETEHQLNRRSEFIIIGL